MLPKLLNHDPQYWITIIIIFSLTLFAWLKTSFNKKLSQLFNSFFSIRVNMLNREEISVSSSVSAALSLLFLVVFSMFIYQFMLLVNNNKAFSFLYSSNPFSVYIKVFLILFFMYLLKVLVVQFLGLLFDAQPISAYYLFNIFLYNQILGIFLLPLIIAVSFVKIISPKQLLYAGIFVFFAMFLYRLIKSVRANHSYKISKYYLFLYLCALEIMPLIVVIKAFISNT